MKWKYLRNTKKIAHSAFLEQIFKMEAVRAVQSYGNREYMRKEKCKGRTADQTVR